MATKVSTNQKDSEVTKSDQKLINRFARLNAKCEDLEEEVVSKNRQLENTCEAINELVLQDEEVLIQSGEVFANMSSASAEEWCEGIRDQLETSLRTMKDSLAAMRSEMTSIKTTLYLKFGSNINLEYED